MVETSVAVATPSTTAARIRNGSTSAGSAIEKSARDLALAGAAGLPGCLAAGSASARQSTAEIASTTLGSRPPVNSAAIDTPVTEPMVMRTRLGGMVSVCAPVADNSATRSPGLAPRAFISGNSTGATAAMSAAFEPEMPETRYIAATST